MHCGAVALALMENTNNLDLVRIWFVKIDDVLLDLEAAASGEAVVARTTSFGESRKHVQSPLDRGSIPRSLAGAPSAPRVQQDVIEVPEG